MRSAPILLVIMTNPAAASPTDPVRQAPRPHDLQGAVCMLWHHQLTLLHGFLKGVRDRRWRALGVLVIMQRQEVWLRDDARGLFWPPFWPIGPAIWAEWPWSGSSPRAYTTPMEMRPWTNSEPF